MVKVHSLAIVLAVNVALVLAKRRSSDTKPDIHYLQTQNGTYNVRVKLDGVSVRLPAELFQQPGHNYQQPLHDSDDGLQFGDDNKDENLDYDVSWFKTKQVKGQSKLNKNYSSNVKQSGVRDVEVPPSKFMAYLLRTMSRTLNRQRTNEGAQ